jgi:hypothetical protein
VQDTKLIRQLAREHPVLITVEEGSIGGFAAHVMQFLALDGLLDGGLKFRPMTLPDRYAAPTAAAILIAARLRGVCSVHSARLAQGADRYTAILLHACLHCVLHSIVLPDQSARSSHILCTQHPD